MNRKVLSWAIWATAALVLVIVLGASAQDWPRTHFHGVINDFPVSANPTAGPWELRGPWSLDLQPHGRADFSASLTMEFSDLAAASGAGTDSRHQHTHHVTMKGATLILNPPQTDCPSGITPYPTYTWVLEVNGMAEVTGNGGSPFTGPVPLQVCLGGGPNLEISNITLVFTALATGPSQATNHFGAQPIHGVVRLPKEPAWGDKDRE
ncbi:MAG TPA: hypothetical protein VMH00_03950 [Candidatus Limnocylindrales bacterium]|nr:hypothetical protein [Candidatus Limnocylindrales bacterium]